MDVLQAYVRDADMFREQTFPGLNDPDTDANQVREMLLGPSQKNGTPGAGRYRAECRFSGGEGGKRGDSSPNIIYYCFRSSFDKSVSRAVILTWSQSWASSTRWLTGDSHQLMIGWERVIRLCPSRVGLSMQKEVSSLVR
jgi:hypothetical protein